jgi:tRNA C32,U32 (ribose-2'-O)-methylase TrmJ
LEASIEDIDYLYATSSATRNINKNYVLSEHLSQDYPTGLKVAIMFGRENCGLKNREITYAHKIININTGSFSSLNIAQGTVKLSRLVLKSVMFLDFRQKEVCE